MVNSKRLRIDLEGPWAGQWVLLIFAADIVSGVVELDQRPYALRWTQQLNPEQADAVMHTQGPLLILAGAGSGKTTVLVNRTGRLIDDGSAQPKQVLVLTFTNKAARELKHRVSQKLVGVVNSRQNIWAGTFHSFGLWLLRRFHRRAGLLERFGIVDQTDSQAILRELLRSTQVVGRDKYDLGKLLELINLERSGKSLNQLAGYEDLYCEMAHILRPKYERKLQVLGVVDLESLLLKPIELLKEDSTVLEKLQSEFLQIMVDEFQDTNAQQLQLVDMLSKHHRNLTVVGDDDQSIYGWRGAEISGILDFPKTFSPCKVIRLERNYRSSSSILDLANSVIAKNKKRHGKTLRSQKDLSEQKKPELFSFENEEEEAQFVIEEVKSFQREGRALRDIAVLYRSNTQSALVEAELRRERIEYSITGGSSIFERKEAKDILAFLREGLWPNEISLRRVIQLPARGVGDTSLDKLHDFSETQKISFHDAILRWKEAGLTEKVARSLIEFQAKLETLPERILSAEHAGQALTSFLEEIDYRKYIQEISGDPQAAEKRWICVEIVGRILESFLARRERTELVLKEFLDLMVLNDSEEDRFDQDRLQLMTLHASKGLEFPVVILIGVEEDLLPHRKLGSDVDEERRLFYVGLTRAQERLLLSRCRTRKRHGSQKPVSISRFILEVPADLYSDYQQGSRPVAGEERRLLVANFLEKLEKAKREATKVEL